MYAVAVRDHVMVAHSLPDPAFGPAQGMHGATFVVELEVRASTLGPQNIVADIGLLRQALRGTLAPLDYANLDLVPDLSGHLTTTEFLARYIFDALARVALEGGFGVAAQSIESMRVTLEESPIARAWYEGSIARP